MPEPLLTPLHLEIVLHYYARAEDMVNLDAPAVQGYAMHLISEGILQSGSKHEGCSLTVTPKGAFWLMSLLSVPFPEQIWKINWPT